LIAKYRGAIIGTAIGDALGAPMETMWAMDIAARFPHFNVESCDYVNSTEQKERSAGRWTDDTQLTIPTAWSIIYKGKIDPEDIAQQYAMVYKDETHRGWGRSTLTSVKRLTEGVPWHKASAPVLGTGNGPAMKAAPLGLVLASAILNGPKIYVRRCMNDIVDVGRITHKDIGIRSGLLQSVLVAIAAIGSNVKSKR